MGTFRHYLQQGSVPLLIVLHALCVTILFPAICLIKLEGILNEPCRLFSQHRDHIIEELFPELFIVFIPQKFLKVFVCLRETHSPTTLGEGSYNMSCFWVVHNPPMSHHGFPASPLSQNVVQVYQTYEDSTAGASSDLSGSAGSLVL